MLHTELYIYVFRTISIIINGCQIKFSLSGICFFVIWNVAIVV
jgi:hypothetical protein